MSILVLCPTRGRPAQTAEMIASFKATAELDMTALLMVIDNDDPELDAYYRLVDDGIGLMQVKGGSLTKATNEAIREVWADADIVGHVGDDHRFVSHAWDRMVEDALREPGICYGDDGVWGEQLGTSWFISTRIVRRLGWLALPVSAHYGIDDSMIDLGKALGCLTYLPDMLITHPSVAEQKVDPDAVFLRAQRTRRQDAINYRRWRDSRHGLAKDVARIRASP